MNKNTKLAGLASILLVAFSIGFPVTTAIVNSAPRDVLAETAPVTMTSSIEAITVSPKSDVSVRTLEEVKIVVEKSSVSSSTRATGPCWDHNLTQGGSPGAPTVRICGFQPGA